MSTSAVNPADDKREKLKKLREFHQPTLNELQIPDAVFIPKMAYRPYGKQEPHIAFFASEINKGEDVYVEFTSKELVPEDPERRLYKWTFNPHFDAEYDKTEPNEKTGHIRYLVPVDELIIIKINKKEEETKSRLRTVSETVQEEINFEIADPNMDLPISQLTIRDLAAILQNKPVSHKQWLNDIING